MAEQELKCNLLTCRRILNPQGKACVTTCSHVFCLKCANRSFEAALVCPACETILTQPDDIVFVELNPTQEYRSSILSGLRPEIVMEICTRAISFWTYQTAQEARFQEMAQKSLEDKLGSLEKQLQKMTRDVNAELSEFRETVSNLQKELEQEKRKGVDLSEQLDEKSRQLSKVQNMYDRQKRRPLFLTTEPPQSQTEPSSATSWNPYGLYRTASATQNFAGIDATRLPPVGAMHSGSLDAVAEPPIQTVYYPLQAHLGSPPPSLRPFVPTAVFGPRRIDDVGGVYPGRSTSQHPGARPRP